jgi:hypothetical protein
LNLFFWFFLESFFFFIYTSYKQLVSINMSDSNFKKIGKHRDSKMQLTVHASQTLSAFIDAIRDELISNMQVIVAVEKGRTTLLKRHCEAAVKTLLTTMPLTQDFALTSADNALLLYQASKSRDVVKGKRIAAHLRAGLTCSAAHMYKVLKQADGFKFVSAEAVIYTTAVINYLATEIILCCLTVESNLDVSRTKRITKAIIIRALQQDVEELGKLYCRYQHVFGGGTVTYPASFMKAPKLAQKKPKDEYKQGLINQIA